MQAQSLGSVDTDILLMMVRVVAIAAVRILEVAVRLDLTGVGTCEARRTGSELHRPGLSVIESLLVFYPALGGNREIRRVSLTPPARHVPTWYARPYCQRGSPMKMAALIMLIALEEMGTLVSEIPELGSPPPQTALSMI